MRDEMGRFAPGSLTNGKHDPRPNVCKNCGITKISCCDRKFCSYGCYAEYRFKKNLGNYKKPKISDACRNAAKAEIINNFKDKSYRRHHSAATKAGMNNPIVKAKLTKKRVKMSDALRKKHSLIRLGIRPKNNTGPGGNSKKGWIEFAGGKKFYMLSSWERNIARYLEFLKDQHKIIEWTYEPKRFIFEKIKFGTKTYLPDFHIRENGGLEYYIEVKGWMDPKSKTKLRRMAKYFPDIKIRIIHHAEYYEIKKTVSPLIKEWE